VLLLGRAPRDYREAHSAGLTTPTFLRLLNGLETPSDSWLGCVHGEDALPDIQVGRLPAGSAEELRHWVDRLLTVPPCAESIPRLPHGLRPALLDWPRTFEGAVLQVPPILGDTSLPAPRLHEGDRLSDWARQVTLDLVEARADLSAPLLSNLLADPSTRLRTHKLDRTREDVPPANADALGRYAPIIRLLAGGEGPTPLPPRRADEPAATSPFSGWKTVAVLCAAGKRCAILEDAQGRQVRVREGQELSGGRVLRVGPNGVILHAAGDNVTLTFR